jgi:hypothetical protein
VYSNCGLLTENTALANRGVSVLNIVCTAVILINVQRFSALALGKFRDSTLLISPPSLSSCIPVHQPSNYYLLASYKMSSVVL